MTEKGGGAGGQKPHIYRENKLNQPKEKIKYFFHLFKSSYELIISLDFFLSIREGSRSQWKGVYSVSKIFIYIISSAWEASA